jgi:hypothetical protein
MAAMETSCSSVSFARTKKTMAPDGTAVVIDPAAGERLQLRPESIQISITDVDRYAKSEPDGYAPITNTIWSWLIIGNPTSPELFRYLLAACGRLDGTHALHIQVSSIMAVLSDGFIGRREQLYRAFSIAEILTVALARSKHRRLGWTPTALLSCAVSPGHK